MDTNHIWNAWVQITSGLSREFVFRGTSEDAEVVRNWLKNSPDVEDYGIDIEYADLTAQDVIEEIASFIDSEV